MVCITYVIVLSVSEIIYKYFNRYINIQVGYLQRNMLWIIYFTKYFDYCIDTRIETASKGDHEELVI